VKKISIQFEREKDGRWIAEAPTFPGAVAYGATKEKAYDAAAALCLRVILDRLENGERTPVSIAEALFVAE
jgi:predicted RNase H-like HicB family nuclease